MGDDEDGICELPAGADRALKGGGGVLMAVWCRAEGSDKDGAGRLCGDMGAQYKEGGDEKDQLLHARQGSKSSHVKNFYEKDCGFKKRNLLLCYIRPEQTS